MCESWDSTVLKDIETVLNRVIPETEKYTYTSEGKDGMPAYAKNCLVGVSLTIPISKGSLQMGTWQGIWLCEHKNSGGSRNLVITLTGISN